MTENVEKIAKEFYNKFFFAADNELNEFIKPIKDDHSISVHLLLIFSPDELVAGFDKIVNIVPADALGNRFRSSDCYTNDDLVYKVLDLIASNIDEYHNIISGNIEFVEAKIDLILANESYKNLVYSLLFFQSYGSTGALSVLHNELINKLDQANALPVILDQTLLDKLFARFGKEICKRKIELVANSFSEEEIKSAYKHIDCLEHIQPLISLEKKIQKNNPCQEVGSLLSENSVSKSIDNIALQEIYKIIGAKNSFSYDVMRSIGFSKAIGANNFKFLIIDEKCAHDSSGFDEDVGLISSAHPSTLVHEMTHMLVYDIFGKDEPYKDGDQFGLELFEYTAKQTFLNVAQSELLALKIDDDLNFQEVKKLIVNGFEDKFGKSLDELYTEVAADISNYTNFSQEEIFLQRITYAAALDYELLTIFTELHQLGIRQDLLGLLEPIKQFWEKRITPEIDKLKEQNQAYCAETCFKEMSGQLVCAVDYNPFKICVVDLYA